MIEGVAHGDGALAVLGEFGPVVRDRSIIIEQTLFRLYMYGGRDDRLRYRKDVEQRVGIDGPSAVLVGEPSPAIDHQFLAQIGGDLDAYFPLFRDGTFDGGLHGPVCGAVDHAAAGS